jgi:hypothetical protein
MAQTAQVIDLAEFRRARTERQCAQPMPTPPVPSFMPVPMGWMWVFVPVWVPQTATAAAR